MFLPSFTVSLIGHVLYRLKISSPRHRPSALCRAKRQCPTPASERNDVTQCGSSAGFGDDFTTIIYEASSINHKVAIYYKFSISSSILRIFQALMKYFTGTLSSRDCMSSDSLLRKKNLFGFGRKLLWCGIAAISNNCRPYYSPTNFSLRYKLAHMLINPSKTKRRVFLTPPPP